MTSVQGTVARGYEGVRDAFAKAQADDPGGAQLCVYRDGKPVVDLWTGRDIAADRPYDADTLTIIMSCTKGALAVCANMLAERGQLDVEAPVARYWPEFGGNGKDKITVAHCLTHTAGLPNFPIDSGFTSPDLLEWERCISKVAAATPQWPAGQHQAYHALTYGYLVGEVIRRITGKSAGTFFAEEIAGPLGLDFWIGLPKAQQARVAAHIPPEQQMPLADIVRGFGIDDKDPIVANMIAGAEQTGDAIIFLNNPAGRAVEIPAGNGVTNARALARMYAATIGDVDGVRLLQPAQIDRARTSRTKQLAPLPPLAKLPLPPSEGYGLGFELGSPLMPMLGKGSFGHAGAGGRLGFAHPESGTAAAYACNSMFAQAFAIDPRWAWIEPLRDAVGSKA
jgi:CubicO group peptidase (beta-lactamase class C family)